MVVAWLFWWWHSCFCGGGGGGLLVVVVVMAVAALPWCAGADGATGEEACALLHGLLILLILGQGQTLLILGIVDPWLPDPRILTLQH